MLQEGKHTGEFIVSESNGNRSRETVILAIGENLSAGTVLGQVTTSKKYKRHNPGASDGTQKAVAILYDNVNATQDTKAVIVARDSEVAKAKLVYSDGADESAKTKALDELSKNGIIGR